MRLAITTVVSVWFLLSPATCSGLSIKFRRTRLGAAELAERQQQRIRRTTLSGAKTLASDDDGSVTLDNYHDLLYIANVTIAGTAYPVQVSAIPWLS